MGDDPHTATAENARTPSALIPERGGETEREGRRILPVTDMAADEAGDRVVRRSGDAEDDGGGDGRPGDPAPGRPGAAGELHEKFRAQGLDDRRDPY